MSSINVINAESPSSFDYLVFPEQNVMVIQIHTMMLNQVW